MGRRSVVQRSLWPQLRRHAACQERRLRESADAAFAAEERLVGMKGSDVVDELKKKFRAGTDLELADKIGLSRKGIQDWKKRKNCTLRQVASLVHSAKKAGARRLRDNAIRPLVEFFEITLCDSRQQKNHERFGTTDRDGESHRYLVGLKDELNKEIGVYLFFDSRGQAIYAGKARQQTLWKEMNRALNRPRGGVQKIKRVKHPKRKLEYRTTDQKNRQPIEQHVKLWEIAAYFSAYVVEDEMIDDVEALIVRSFANNLLNKRMERFTRHRGAK